MRSRAAIVALVAAAGIAAALFYTRTASTVAVDVQAAVRGPIEEIVTAVSAGTVKSRTESTIGADVGGRVVAVRAREGDVVRRGDVLALFDDAEASRQVDGQEADVRQAEQQVAQAGARREEAAGKLRSDTARAHANLARVESEHRRAEELFRGGFLSRSDMEQVAAQLANADEDARVAALGEAAVRAADREIAALAARRDAARAALAASRERRRKMTVTAPFDGIVLKRSVEPGETKLPGAPLFLLADPKDVRVEAQIDESESARVRVGQAARLFPEAYRGEMFRGTVSEVKPVVEVSREVSRANTIFVSLVSPPKPLRLGMSVDVEVVIGGKDNVLLAPSAAVMEREGRKFLYVAAGGRVVRRDVTTGVSNWDRTEILSGIAPGDRIVTSLEIKDLGPGSRVEIRNGR